MVVFREGIGALTSSMREWRGCLHMLRVRVDLRWNWSELSGSLVSLLVVVVVVVVSER